MNAEPRAPAGQKDSSVTWSVAGHAFSSLLERGTQISSFTVSSIHGEGPALLGELSTKNWDSPQGTELEAEAA